MSATNELLLDSLGWVPCSPGWLSTHPGQCGTAPRWSDKNGDAPQVGEVVSHWHPRETRAQVLAEVVAAIEDPEQRDGLGWESARGIAQDMLIQASCLRCKGSGIDPDHSTPGDWYGDYPEPPALEPCIACQYVRHPPASPDTAYADTCGEPGEGQ